MSAAMPAAIPQIAPAPVMPSQLQPQSQAHVPIREPSSQVSAQGAPPPTPASHLLPHSHLGSSSGTSLRPAPAPMSRAAPTKSPGVSALQPPLPLSTWTSEFGVALLQEILLAHGPPKAAEWSLFAPDDPVLRRAQRGRAPYAKHLLQRTADGKFTFQPTQKGWTVGRKAAESGLEYRAFFEPGAESRRTFGAVRFSSSARADEDGFDDYVHGGAIQSLLDEATAECAMVTVCVLPTTAEASFKIVRKVVPDRSLLFECEVVEETVPNLKFKVVGRLLDPQGDFLLAKCTATIANIGAIPEARRERYGE
jgi:acyl-coenzyme A thioesterase PaaI-like protein